MQHKVLSAMFLIVAWVIAGAPLAAAQDSPAILAESCASCHGPGGLSVDSATPVIAGLSKGSLIGAMLAYQHPDDIAKAQDLIDGDPELIDIVIMARPSISEQHIPKGYAIDEIKALANYFGAQAFVGREQVTDPAKTDEGRVLHKRYCEKCHQDGGRNTVDDVGRLAGQWRPYLVSALADFLAGEREMPKKMAKKLEKLLEKDGGQAIEALTHFYASQR